MLLIARKIITVKRVKLERNCVPLGSIVQEVLNIKKFVTLTQLLEGVRIALQVNIAPVSLNVKSVLKVMSALVRQILSFQLIVRHSLGISVRKVIIALKALRFKLHAQLGRIIHH